MRMIGKLAREPSLLMPIARGLGKALWMDHAKRHVVEILHALVRADDRGKLDRSITVQDIARMTGDKPDPDRVQEWLAEFGVTFVSGQICWEDKEQTRQKALAFL